MRLKKEKGSNWLKTTNYFPHYPVLTGNKLNTIILLPEFEQLLLPVHLEHLLHLLLNRYY